MKRGKEKRRGIDISVLKEKEGEDYDDANLWEEHGAEWGNTHTSSAGT